MKRIRIIAVLLALIMLAASFASCRNAQESTDTETTVPESTSDTGDTGTTDTEDPSPVTEPDTDTTAPDSQTDTSPATDTDPTTEPATQTDPVTEPDTDTATEPETSVPETTPAETTPAPVVTYGKITDMYFRQVFGTGKNNDTPARYGFIELRNSSKDPVKLSGYSVSYYDAASKKYVSVDFPDVTVPAATSYLIRCAEAKGANGEAYKETGERVSVKYYDLSWNVVLDNKEIQLAVTDKGKTPDSARVSQAKNVYVYFIASQAVTADKNTATGISKNKAAFRTSKDAKYILVDYKNAPASEITDRAPMCLKGDLNAQASASGNVVGFSHTAGFYSSPIDLKLTARDGYTIYYTTDGSDPRKTGTKYTGAIKLNSTELMPWGTLTKLCNSLNGSANPRSSRQPGAKVVKAYATNGKISTQVVTNSYFISTGLLKYDTLILSMSIEPGEFLSSDRGIYHTQMAHPFDTKMRRTAFFEIMETTGERVSASYIEIALNGNGSLGFSAKSIRTYFKADADPDYVGNPSKLKYDVFKGQARDGVTEYKRLLLRNSGNDSSQTHLRDAYMQTLCSKLNCPTMAYRPALLFINGEMWGVYNVRERYDAKYFESHYGIPEEDFCMLESISPLITGSWNTPYALNDGVEDDEKPFHQLVSYIENNDLSDDEKFKYVSDRIDIDNIVDFFVGSMFLCNTDWPGNNIKVWRNKNASNKNIDTKWRFAFCDMDMGVGLATNIDTNMFNHAINDGTVAGRIFNRMLRNEAFKEKFINRFYECADTIFDTSVTLPLLDKMTAAIKDIMPLHFNRWPSDGGSVNNFNAQINNVRYFMQNRKAKAIAHMEAFFRIQPKKYTISFDEDSAEITVNGKKVTSGYSEILKGETKIALEIKLNDGYELVALNTVSSSGKTKTYNLTSVTLNVDSTLNVTVITRKAGVTATPAIVTGSTSVFALTEDGRLYVWGANDYGQLGITSSTVTTPTLVASGVIKVATSMGGTEGNSPMTAIITSSGTVYTAGNNGSGQLGRTGDAQVFSKVATSFRVKDVTCGFDHMIIIAENGDMYGVGNNSYGQLGQAGFGGNVTKLQKIDSSVKMAAAGRRHTIYIKENGDLVVLGDNRWNKFNTSGEATLTSPYKLGEGFVFVSTGQHNCLAVNGAGELYYIGWRSTATFNAGESAGAPVKIADGMKEAYIMDEHIIMLGTDGKVYGYGLNNFKQISEDAEPKFAPEFITDNCVTCGAGTHYSAAVKADGKVMVWGNNSQGVIGNGKAADEYTAPYNAITLK